MGLYELEKQLNNFLSLATKKGWYNPKSETARKWISAKAFEHYYSLEKEYNRALAQAADADFSKWKESQ